MPGRLVYTVGHGSRGLGELLGILRRYGVRVVVDVRRYPFSRRWPWWSRSVLAEYLPSRRIGYIWLGDLLGGRRAGGYEAYTATESYRRGIEALTAVIEAARGPVAVFCAERLWRRCHRRYIADSLAEKGYRVVHILGLGETEPHPGKPWSPRGRG
jgi:uncharacterized protein (DUF488 family)